MTVPAPTPQTPGSNELHNDLDNTPHSDPHERLDWQRVHRATPFIRGWIVLVAVGYALLQNGGMDMFEDGIDRTVILFSLGGLVLFAAVWILYGWLAWRRMAYAYDFESVYMKSGIVFRQEQKVRLDRIQSIDITKPLIARLVGLAELRITSAASSAFRIGFLSEAAANQLRNEILARAAGVVTQATVTQPGGVPVQTAVPGMPLATDPVTGAAFAGDPVTGQNLTGEAPTPAGQPAQTQPAVLPVLAQEAPEQIIYQVPPQRTIAAALLSVIPLLALLIVIAMLVLFLTGNGSIALTMLPALFGFGPFAWNRFVGEYGFTAANSADGIRVRQGLLETKAQTIPPGRVQAIRLRQGLLWRKLGWWRADLNIAGQGLGENNGFSGSILLPVGTAKEAIDALWLVLPDLGVDNPLEVLEAAMTGKGTDQGFTVSPNSAKWLDPLSFRRNGYRVLGRALLIRKGVLVRTIELVPHERTQSLGLKQGPLQRMLGLTSFTLHSTTGMITPTVAHLSNDHAAALLAHQNERATIARHGQGPEKWMEQIRG